MHQRISRRAFLRGLLHTAGGVAASRVLSGCATDPLQQITLLHMNDLHGALYAKAEEYGERGGAANLVGLIERKRADAPGSVVLLDSGDAFQGTLVSNINQGEAVIEIMNLAKVDAFALGNHEFDWGLDVLQERSRQASFPFLAANLETESGQMLEGVLPYTVVDAGGVQVGVLGLTYHDIQTIVKASAIAGLHSLPPVETVKRYLPELQRRSDLIVVLSHLGFQEDVALARAVPEIPLIVGGHTHIELSGGHQVGDTLIVQAGAYGRSLGQLAIGFDRRKKEIVDVDATRETIKVTDAGTANAAVQRIVEKWGAQVEEMGAQIIGEAAIRLRKGRGEETALGNLITDAMRSTDLGDGQAFDIALHNDGGIRADVDAGEITFAELYAVLPFDNNLVGLSLTGAQVKEMLENGINSHASEIQVSGLRFVYTLNKAQGRRVMEVLVNGETLQLERVYRVITIDYLYSHPQYEDSLGQGAEVFFGGLCLDAIRDYIGAHSPVAPRIEGRIQKM